VRHQLVVGAILRRLLELADRERGLAVDSPVDVVLADHSIVQPDVTGERGKRLPSARARG
jgi:hypothetical protein